MFLRKVARFMGILCILLLAAIPISAVAQVFKKTRKSRVKTPFVLWDIDDVVSEQSEGIFGMIRRNEVGRKQLWGAGCLSKNVAYWAKLLASARFAVKKSREGVAVHVLNLSEKYNSHARQLIIDVANGGKRPIEGSVSVMRDLKQAGVKQFAGSNMGDVLFHDLRTRPGFEFLDECLDIRQSQQVTIDGLDRRVCKPYVEFFTDFLEKNSELSADSVIFIDDKKKNVDAARKAGMHAIVFKSPDQLRKDLGFLLGREFGVALAGCSDVNCVHEVTPKAA